MALAASVGHSARRQQGALDAGLWPGSRRRASSSCLAALRRRSAALGGLAAGLCYGVGDVTSKALLITLPHHPGPGALAASPYLYATAGAHGLGFVVLQRAFQHGGPIASLGPMTAAANLLPMAAGVLLLGEGLPHGGLALALARRRVRRGRRRCLGACAGTPRRRPWRRRRPSRRVWLQPSLPTAMR